MSDFDKWLDKQPAKPYLSKLEIGNMRSAWKEQQKTIDKIKRINKRVKISRKINKLSAVFTDYSKFHVKESSTHTVIEIDFEALKKLNFDFKNKKKIRINGVKIVFLDFNKIVLIREKKYDKLFIDCMMIPDIKKINPNLPGIKIRMLN